MKEIEFDESELSNLQGLAEKLFSDENDPRSNSYVRKLVRPKLNWLKVILFLTAPVLFSTVIAFVLYSLGVKGWITSLVILAAVAIYWLALLKPATICAVKIYQRFAPSSIRCKCRFEPSCSEYMILSIEKYGIFKGIKKGIGRLKRCNVNNGGFDYP